MTEEFDLTSYGQLSVELRDEVADGINLRSVIILGKSTDSDWRQVGSGTLVRFRNLTGILTAGHVVEALETTEWLGFNVSDRAHLLSVRTELVSFDRFYDKSNEGMLPDLGFIGLPHVTLVDIEAKQKAVYNLELRGDRPLQVIDRLKYAAWVIWGSPGELTTIEQTMKPVGQIQLHKGQSHFCGLVPSGDYGDTDALIADVDYGNCVGEIPSTFGGCSGGGLWHVPLIRRPEGEVRPKEYILAGVVCLESARIGNELHLVCHGPVGMLAYLNALCRKLGT